MTRTAGLLLLAALAAGCESPPEERCRAVPGESSVDFECDPDEEEEWQQRALDEASEGMDRRSPDGRP